MTYQDVCQLAEKIQTSNPKLVNSQNSVTQEELLNSSELCDKLKISLPTLLRWRNKGKIPFVKIGKSYRYHLSNVLKALEKKKGGAI